MTCFSNFVTSFTAFYFTAGYSSYLNNFSYSFIYSNSSLLVFSFSCSSFIVVPPNTKFAIASIGFLTASNILVDISSYSFIPAS